MNEIILVRWRWHGAVQWVHIAAGQTALLAPGPTDTQAAVLGALGPTDAVSGHNAGSTLLAEQVLQARAGTGT